jgi:hypothetical protein
MTLNDYVLETQRLLHDAQSQIWPVTPDLINYINKARDRVVLDCLATRVLPVITLNALQERYNYTVVQSAILGMSWTSGGGAPPSRGVATIMGINCVQNTAYQPVLDPLSWGEFNMRYRQGGPLNPAAFPSAWAPFGDNQNFYIANVPGSTLTAEIDCTYLPNKLVNLTDTETAIADPLNEIVTLMAARWAMYYQDDFAAAEKFMAHYTVEKNNITACLPHFKDQSG